MVYRKNLNIKRQSYDNLNRFEGEMKVDLNELQTNLVPLARLHFMTSSMVPVLTKLKQKHTLRKMRYNQLVRKCEVR